jgi:hypothetical protein
MHDGYFPRAKVEYLDSQDLAWKRKIIEGNRSTVWPPAWRDFVFRVRDQFFQAATIHGNKVKLVPV